MGYSATFHGDRKYGHNLLWHPEQSFVAWMLPRIPSWLQGYHLTLTTLLWSAGVVLCCWFAAREGYHWLWLSSVCVVMQWATDSLDGALGRTRNFGIPRWGYYMDHFFDYFFLCSMFAGHAFLLEGVKRELIFLLLLLFIAFMVHSFLYFAVMEKFQISYLGLGPTEWRVVYITVTTLIIVFGVRALYISSIFLTGLLSLGLCITVWKSQREIWQADMTEKAGRDRPMMT